MRRVNRPSLLALAALLLAGCTPLAETFVPELSRDAGRPCGEGFASADGLRCEPTLPADACPAGTMPRLGTTTCVPVGWTTCPAGFGAGASGWGCEPQLPSTTCAGATTQRLGSTTCQPVGDCTAPFPPAGATLFVDPAGPLDATHFHTLAAAVSAAAPGATIAVSPGTYLETLSISRAVSLVGRCASAVELRSSGAGAPGVLINAGGALQLSGMTLQGHRLGVSVSAGGSAVVRECALLGNRDAQALVDGAGAALTLRDSVVRDGVAQTGPSWGRGVMAQGGATVTLERVSLEHNQAVSVLVLGPATTAHLDGCVVRDTAPSAAGDGLGLALEGAAKVDVTRSAFVGHQGRAISVKVGALTLTQSTLSDTLARPSGATGFGLSVSQGGSADISESAITRNHSLGVSLADPGSRVSLTDSVVSHTQASDSGEMGLEASEGTTLTLLRSAVVENVSVGLGLFGADTTLTQSLVGRTRANLFNAATGLNLEGGQLRAVDSALDANDSLGVLINEPNPTTAKEHTFTGCVVMNTVPLAGGGPGRGVSVQGGLVAFAHSAVVGNAEVAIFLRSQGTRVRATDCALLRTRLDPDGRYGFGVVARDGAWWQSVNTDVRGNAAVGLAFADASGSVDLGLIGDQPVGLETQGTTTLAAVRAVSAAPPPGVLEVTDGTSFVDNGSKVGAGNIPLPSR